MSKDVMTAKEYREMIANKQQPSHQSPLSKYKALDKYYALGRKKVRKMNKTERLYADLLERKKSVGEIIDYWFEMINLRIGDNCFYRIDFLVMNKDCTLEVHETKGGHITDDSLVKIRAAAEIYPFKFIMMQLVKGEWHEREL